MRIHCAVLSFIFILLLPLLSVAQESKTERRIINLPRGELANLPFSDAVMAGNTLYISGRGGIDLKTMKVPADPREEVKLLLEDYG